MSHSSSRLLACVLALSLALLAVAASGASARTLRFPDVSATPGKLVFKPVGVTAATVRSARVVQGAHAQRLSLRRVRAGVRRGVLRVSGAPRRQRAVLRIVTTLRATTARKRPKSTTTPTPTPTPTPEPTPSPTPAPTPAPSTGRLASFETGDFSELDVTGMLRGSIAVSSERGYDGTRSARATYDGTQDIAYARSAYDVNWGEGSDVWYGAALYIPDLAFSCWFNPIRWDNYPTYGGQGDTGGLQIVNGELYVAHHTFSGPENYLMGPIPIPQARWFHVEVHQRLSGTNGQALTELYVDGRLVGTSTLANSFGRVVNRIHYGIVAIAPSCSRAGSVSIDRVSVSNGQRGPISA